jgi:7-keto-8-aminopelargonate synthetase-like enzyme
MQLKARLLDRGIFPTFIHYPGGANDGYFRLAVSSEHTPELVTALTEAFDVKAALSKKGKR